MIKYLTGLLIAILILSSCGSTDTTDESNTTDNTSDSSSENTSGEYTSFVSDGLVSLKYPSTWSAQEGFMGTIIAIMSPVENENDMFSENINFLIQNFSDVNVDTLEDYIQFNLDQMETLFSEFKVVSRENTNIDGVAGKKIIYTFIQGEVELHTTQYILEKDNMAYIFTITHGQDNIESYQTEFNTILNSVKIL